jgi:hypothetical protein
MIGLNLTIASLAMTTRLSTSPFFSFASIDSRRSILFSHLNFRKWFTSFMNTRAPGSFHFSRCGFQSFLSTPIIYSGGGIKENVNFTSEIINEHIQRDWRNVTIANCRFTKCHGDKGGGFFGWYSNVTIFDSVFEENTARIGGGAHILNSDFIHISRLLVARNRAEYDGGLCTDTEFEGNFSDVDTINITFNRAEKWTGGFRMDHAGGNLTRCYFEGNSAVVCGAFFDFTWSPSERNIRYCVFKNNTSISRGGAYTAFHILQIAHFADDIFLHNFCNLSAYSISVESIDEVVTVTRCVFDGPQDREVAMRFPGESELTVTESDFEVGGERLRAAFEKAADPIRDRFGEPPRDA